jgi:hypothetical protein
MGAHRLPFLERRLVRVPCGTEFEASAAEVPTAAPEKPRGSADELE